MFKPSRFSSAFLIQTASAVLLGMLVACGTPVPELVDAESEAAAVVPEQASSPLAPRLLDDEERHRRYVADILYSGMQALRADRLMTPPEDSALHYFSRALALDPGNTVALDGLQDVLRRYLQLADTASHQGQFGNAELFLRRAAEVDDSHPGIATSRQRLLTEQARTHSVLTVDVRELRSRNGALAQQLRDLAGIVVSQKAFVLITAPSDELGRWIYAQMQDALVDHRVRGDIEIGEQPTVRLVLPETAPQTVKQAASQNT